MAHGMSPATIWERLGDGSVRDSGRMQCCHCHHVIVWDPKAHSYRHTREYAPYLEARPAICDSTKDTVVGVSRCIFPVGHSGHHEGACVDGTRPWWFYGTLPMQEPLTVAAETA